MQEAGTVATFFVLMAVCLGPASGAGSTPSSVEEEVVASEPAASVAERPLSERLHDAVERGQVRTVRRLVQAGADPDEPREGETPLFVASAAGRVELVKALLELGAHVDSCGFAKWTALHAAATYARRDVAQVLLDNGADPNALDYREWTPLHEAAFRGAVGVARALIAAGADVNARSQTGATPLHYSAWLSSSRKSVVELLLAKGAHVHARDKGGRTALHSAAGLRRRGALEVLVGAGADVNARDDEGDTPLHVAARCGKKGFVAFLCENGAAINARDATGETPLAGAARLGHKDIVEILAARGARYGICSAIHIGDLTTAEALLAKRPALVDARDARGDTPLHLAVETGQEGLCRLLIAKGADLSAEDREGLTPLRRAVELGKVDIVELLITHGAHANDRSDGHRVTGGRLPFGMDAIEAPEDTKLNFGEVPLHWAARNGNLRMVRMLMAHGADVNATDIEGRTPLRMALHAGHKEVAEFLRQHGGTEHGLGLHFHIRSGGDP